MSENNSTQSMQELMEKVKNMQNGKGGTPDLSLEEDLSIAIMNLISLEEHFFFTALKTENNDYLRFMDETRAIRKSLLGKMIEQHEGETWCISKHLLAATMRMMEVGTKYYSSNKTAEAEEIFSQAHKVYGLFWAIRLKLLDMKGLKKIGDDQLNVHDKDGKGGKPWRAEDIVNKLVNCCNE